MKSMLIPRLDQTTSNGSILRYKQFFNIAFYVLQAAAAAEGSIAPTGAIARSLA
jgi:hypothetical protein